jgi:histone arginine demethylase JMJD6
MPRISCNTSKEEFRALYETPRLPVILEGCDSGWPASWKWNRRTFSERFDNETTFVGKFHNRRVDLDNYESWGWIKNAMETGAEEYYVFDSLIAHPEVSKLQHDFDLPAPIENIYLKMEDFPPGYGPSRWFTYGSKGSGTRPHLDPIAADAWNYVARGYKWWILFPRGEEVNYDNLYCAHDCSTEKWKTDHWFAEVGVNAGFNEYDGTNPYKRPVHVLQKPGEVVYIPNGMVHAVLNLDHTIAVAAHFASTQNLQEVWNTIVGLGSDKHWQQAYFSGILDREQRRFVRSVSGSWPPKPGDMYFYDGPFLEPKKRRRQTDANAETEYFDDSDDAYDDDDDDDDDSSDDDDDDSSDDSDAYDDDDGDGFIDDDEIEEDERY